MKLFRSSYWKYYMLPFCAAANVTAWIKGDMWAAAASVLCAVILAALIDSAEQRP